MTKLPLSQPDYNKKNHDENIKKPLTISIILLRLKK